MATSNKEVSQQNGIKRAKKYSPEEKVLVIDQLEALAETSGSLRRKYQNKGEMAEQKLKQLSNEISGNASDSMQGNIDWSSWRPPTLKEPKSKELVIGAKRKRNMDVEKIKLIKLQQKFYRDEITRAQEKHELELQSLKYKNELLQLELAKKKT